MLFEPPGGTAAGVVSGAREAGASLKEIECRKFHQSLTAIYFSRVAVSLFGQH